MKTEIPKCKKTENGEHRWDDRDHYLPADVGINVPGYVEVTWECHNCGLVISQAYTSDNCGWDIEEE